MSLLRAGLRSLAEIDIQLSDRSAPALEVKELVYRQSPPTQRSPYGRRPASCNHRW